MSDNAHILIVDDEPNVRLVFRTALMSNDYILFTAEDGETALRWLKQQPADVVLLDLQMPGMGGMEVLGRLRKAGCDVPVVIVSAHDQVRNIAQAMRLGAVDFLPKPATPEALRKVVAQVLSRRDDRPSARSAYLVALRVDPEFEPARLHLMKDSDDKST